MIVVDLSKQEKLDSNPREKNRKLILQQNEIATMIIVTEEFVSCLKKQKKLH